MIDDEYPLGFRLALHRKDLGIALEMAGEAGVDASAAMLAAALEDRLARRRPRRRGHVGPRPRDPRAVGGGRSAGIRARLSAQPAIAARRRRASGPSIPPARACMIRAMNYELFMGEALAEAQLALDQGKAPIGAVAVVNDAMVARAHDRVQESNDPTAHAVVVALREAARKLGRDRLADATIFVTREPCPMCVGALLACDVEALVFAVSNSVDGAAGRRGAARPGRHGCRASSRSSAASAARKPRSSSPRRDRSKACARPSGSRPPRAEAAVGGRPGRRRDRPRPPLSAVRRHGRRRRRRLARLWYSLARRGVRVVEGAALEKRCARAPWVRIPPSPPLSQSPSRRPGRSATCPPRGPSSAERSPSGLGRRTGNAVWGNPSRVQIPPSPPLARPAAPAAAPAVRRRSPVLARLGTCGCYDSRAVLGGELAVPCTCNPLQQG